MKDNITQERAAYLLRTYGSYLKVFKDLINTYANNVKDRNYIINLINIIVYTSNPNFYLIFLEDNIYEFNKFSNITTEELFNYYLNNDIFINLNIQYNILSERNIEFYGQLLNFQYEAIGKKFPYKISTLLDRLNHALKTSLDTLKDKPVVFKCIKDGEEHVFYKHPVSKHVSYYIRIKYFSCGYLEIGFNDEMHSLTGDKDNIKHFEETRNRFIETLSSYIKKEIFYLDNDKLVNENNLNRLRMLRMLNTSNLNNFGYNEIVELTANIININNYHANPNSDNLFKCCIELHTTFVEMVMAHTNLPNLKGQ